MLNEDINPVALAQLAQMIQDSVCKGAAAMPRTTQTTTNDHARQLEIQISDYTQHLEQMTLASEDLLKLEALFEGIKLALEKDPLSFTAERLACIGSDLAKIRAEYFEDSANDLEATIDQLEREVEAEEGEE